MGYVTGPTHLSAEAGFGGRVWTTVLATPRNLGTFREGFWSGHPTQYDEVYHFTQGWIDSREASNCNTTR